MWPITSVSPWSISHLLDTMDTTQPLVKSILCIILLSLKIVIAFLGSNGNLCGFMMARPLLLYKSFINCSQSFLILLLC